MKYDLPTQQKNLLSTLRKITALVKNTDCVNEQYENDLAGLCEEIVLYKKRIARLEKELDLQNRYQGE